MATKEGAWGEGLGEGERLAESRRVKGAARYLLRVSPPGPPEPPLPFCVPLPPPTPSGQGACCHPSLPSTRMAGEDRHGPPSFLVAEVNGLPLLHLWIMLDTFDFDYLLTAVTTQQWLSSLSSSSVGNLPLPLSQTESPWGVGDGG